MYHQIAPRVFAAVALIAVSIYGVACAPKAPPRAPAETYYDHYVKYQGETLGLIASWYTGSPNNWKAILQHNPGLDPRRIRKGDLVQVPRSFMVKDVPMTQKFVASKQRKSATGELLPPPDPAQATVMQPPSNPDALEAAPAENVQAETEAAPAAEEAAAEQPESTDEVSVAAEVAPESPPAAAAEPSTETAKAEAPAEAPSQDLAAESERIKKREELLQELIGN